MSMPLELPRYTTHDLHRFPPDGQRYELVQGQLLVTPAPSQAHQVVTARLFRDLLQALPEDAPARVVSPGEIEVAPGTLMNPDILVYPASFPLNTGWTAIRDWWLAIEVHSPSTRLYDRDFKRPAYLALGVREVWLVDLEQRAVFVTLANRKESEHRDSVLWQPPTDAGPVRIELAGLFRGLS
jgi:Uma2 family endonuclease